MSKSISLLAAAMVALSASSAAASDKSSVQATVREMIAKMNAGKDVSALLDADGSAIDDFAPFSWGRFTDWGAANQTYVTQNAIANVKEKATKFRHVIVANGRAYVVLSAVWSFEQGGKIRHYPGLEVLTLHHADPGWKVDSYAWFGRTGVDAGADATAINAVIQDFASLKSGPSSDTTAITDEFPPFAWKGATASADWYAALQKLLADGHATGIALATAAPSELQINGGHAYASVPTVITTTVGGKAKREKGDFAFALQKTAGAWHITSWAWATE
jgi:hypothetical protein